MQPNLGPGEEKTKKFDEILVKNSLQTRKNQWFSMKFIKNLARPLLLDFAGALKKTLDLRLVLADALVVEAGDVLLRF